MARSKCHWSGSKWREWKCVVKYKDWTCDCYTTSQYVELYMFMTSLTKASIRVVSLESFSPTSATDEIKRELLYPLWTNTHFFEIEWINQTILQYGSSYFTCTLKVSPSWHSVFSVPDQYQEFIAEADWVVSDKGNRIALIQSSSEPGCSKPSSTNQHTIPLQ